MKYLRRGLTLFEVVIALAIFLGAVVALSHLINVGTDRALDVQQQAQASMLCQSKLAEVLAGKEPVTGTNAFVAFGGDPYWSSLTKDENVNWTYNVESTPSGLGDNLYKVKVTVRLERPDGKIIDASLAQMVLDPALRGSTLDAAADSSSSSSSGSGSTTSDSTTSGAASGTSSPGSSSAGTKGGN